MRQALLVSTLFLLGSAYGRAETARDPAIARLIGEVSATRLRADDERLVAFGTRSTFSTGGGDQRGVFAARDWITEEFRQIAARSDGRMSVGLDGTLQKADRKRIPRDVEISSVIATLRGSDPGGRTYVMSSHYDSRNSDNADGIKDAPGADDNGSGTAAVIEAARVLAAVPLRATVIFAAYDAEEQGLLGSAHHAQALKAAGADVQGDLNNDIIGASVDGHGEKNAGEVRIFSEALAAGAEPSKINLVGNENDSPSRELARFAADTGDTYVPGLRGRLVFRADRVLRGGDHESFNAAGFAAIRFVEPVENFAHQHQDVRTDNGTEYGDLAKFVDFDYLAQVTRYNVAVLASLALGPGRPHDAFVEAKALTNETTLAWSSVADAVTYEIVRRRTTEPAWSAIIDAGHVTAMTVPFSKDDWLFGVRAVDARGHRGVATFPLPRR